MRYFEILLPGTAENTSFEDDCLAIAGGFTKTTANGVWRDPSGVAIWDHLISYRVACTGEQWKKIKAKAIAIFDEEQAIFVAELGQAEILPGLAAQKLQAAE